MLLHGTRALHVFQHTEYIGYYIEFRFGTLFAQPL